MDVNAENSFEALLAKMRAQNNADAAQSHGALDIDTLEDMESFYSAEPVETKVETTTQVDPFQKYAQFYEEAPQQTTAPAAEEPAEQPTKKSADTAEDPSFDDITAMFTRKTPSPIIPEANSSMGDKAFKKLLSEQEEPEEEVKVFEKMPIEKPGVIVERQDVDVTRDLQALPKLIAAEDVLEQEKTIRLDNPVKVEKKVEPEEPEEEVSGQIVFPDYQKEEKTKQVDEEKVVADLQSRRTEKVGKFKLDKLADTCGREAEKKQDPLSHNRKEAPVPREDAALEYKEPLDRQRVGAELFHSMRKRLTLAMITAAVFAVYGIISLFPAILSGAEFYTDFTTDSTPMAVISLVALLAGTFFARIDLWDGCRAVKEKHITTDTLLTCGTLLVFAQNVAAIFVKDTKAIPLYTGAVLFAQLLNHLGYWASMKRVVANFKYCAHKNADNLWELKELPKEGEGSEIGRCMMMGHPSVYCNKRVMFPQNFVERSMHDNTLNLHMPRLLLITGILALLAGGAAWFGTRNPYAAVSGVAGVFAMGVPVVSLWSVHSAFQKENNKLNCMGGAVLSLQDAKNFRDANAIVMEATDLFDPKQCKVRGLKDFHSVKINDVVTYITAVLMQSGNPMRQEFRGSIASDRENILPEVRGLKYEDKMGISCIIENQTVLLGNRRLMEAHNIEMPSRKVDERHLNAGRQVTFLAVADKIAAMYVSAYSVDLTLQPVLQALEKHGVTFLVSNNDANINREMLCEAYEIEASSLYVLSAQAGRTYKRTLRDAEQGRDTGLYHNNKLKTMLHTAKLAQMLVAGEKTAAFIQIASLVLGALLLIVFGLTGKMQIWNAWIVAVYEAVFCLLCRLTITLPGKKRKPKKQEEKN